MNSLLFNQIKCGTKTTKKTSIVIRYLKSRPVWGGFVEREKLDQLKDYMCLDNVCVGSR